ncbi:hypothetical protein QBC35DRAFT_538897, partial [Podospora australis]
MARFLLYLFFIVPCWAILLDGRGRYDIPNSNTTTLLLEKRQAIVTRFSTLFLKDEPQRSARQIKPSTAALISSIVYGDSVRLQLLLHLTVASLENALIDMIVQRDVGLHPLRRLSRGSGASFCSTALLSLSNDIGPFTYLACGGGPSTDIYLAFTTSTAASSKSVLVSPRPTSSDPSIASQTSKTLVQNTSLTESRVSSNTADNGVTTTDASPSNQNTRGSNDFVVPQPNNTSDSTNSRTPQIGAIIGGVVGSLALLCMFGLAAIWLQRRNKTPRPASKESNLQPLKKEEISAEPMYELGGWGPHELPAGYVAPYSSSRQLSPVELSGVPLQKHR